MKIEYKTLIEVVAVYDTAELSDYESKTPTEFTTDLSHYICDEITTAGGVGTVNEVCSKRTITYSNGETSTRVAFSH